MANANSLVHDPVMTLVGPKRTKDGHHFPTCPMRKIGARHGHHRDRCEESNQISGW